jgi:cytochrome b involved in lipid metabolism
MSARDQSHQHRWQRRVKDWLIVPHSAYSNPHDVTLAELQSHNTRGDCWLCVHGVVYDLSRFMPYHPGGTKIIEQYAGRDCTPAYMRNHLKLDPEDVVANCRVGLLVANTPASGGAEGGLASSSEEEALGAPAGRPHGAGGAELPPPPYFDRRVPLIQSFGSLDVAADVLGDPAADASPATAAPAAAGSSGAASASASAAGGNAAGLVTLATQSGLYAHVARDKLEAAAAAVDAKKDDVTEASALEALFAVMLSEGGASTASGEASAATANTRGEGGAPPLGATVSKAAVRQLLASIGELGAEAEELLDSCPDPVTCEQFVALVQML